MKIAIISDIHSNFEALKEVIKKIDSLDIDKIICLGDIIGYGPSPNQCLDLVFKTTSTTLIGNHEFALLNPQYLQFFSENAKAGINYTKQILFKHYITQINDLPFTYSFDNLIFSHACISEPQSFKYITTPHHAIQELQFIKYNHILFIGHTHYPIIFEQNKNESDNIKIINDLSINFNKNSKYIINVGSIGQPRNGDNRSSFFIYDTKKNSGKYYKISYNIDIVYEKIKNIPDLPIFLGERLYKGV